jgi:SecD/SecF fusion protein
MADGATFSISSPRYKQSSICWPTIAHDIRRDRTCDIFAFRGFPVHPDPLQYGDYSAGGVIALFHDSMVTVGMFSVLYHRVPFNLEIDQTFIAAILTIIGYSINDTVIIFDRIREYMKLHPKRDRKENMNSAINDTLSRTFSTSFSTLCTNTYVILCGVSIRGLIFAS